MCSHVFTQAVLKDPFLDLPFSIFIYTVFLAIMIMMGAEIELRVIWTKLKRPVGIIIGFISQYLFMPAVWYRIYNSTVTPSYSF